VDVVGQGKSGEAVYGHAGISLVRGRNATKGLDELDHLLELDEDKERNWTLIESRASDLAIDWERRFAVLAPTHAREVAIQAGQQLLDKTARERLATQTILIQLGTVFDLPRAYSRLLAECSHQERRRAEILFEWPGVVQIPDADLLYRTATLAVARYTFGSADYGADPLRDQNLMWLIQLLVDAIAMRSCIME